MGEEIHRVVQGGFIPSAKPGMILEIEHWRPVENLRPEDKAIGYRFNLKVGVEALIGRERKVSDVVLNLGLDFLCARGFQSGTTPAVMGFAGIGTDATAAARNQSNLIAEVMRNPATYTKDAPTGEASVDAVFAVGVSGYSLNECGLVNMSGLVSGIFYCRDTYTARNVISGDTVNLYYTASFSGA